jgi:exportin-5
MTLITPGQPIEARHFGYGVLQHVVAKRMDEFTPANAPEPFMIKSKVATLMAEIVRRQGASLWTSLMPDLAAGANSEVRSIHWSPYDRVGVVNADP